MNITHKDQLLARKAVLEDGIDRRHLRSFYEDDVLEEIIWSVRAKVEIDQINQELDSLRTIEEV